MKAAFLALLLAAIAGAKPAPAPASRADDVLLPPPPALARPVAPTTIATAPNDTLPNGLPACLIPCAEEGTLAVGCPSSSDWDCICASQEWSVVALLCLVRLCPQDVTAGYAWHSAYCYRNSPPPDPSAPERNTTTSNAIAAAVDRLTSAAASSAAAAAAAAPTAVPSPSTPQCSSGAEPALTFFRASSALSGLAAAAAAAAAALVAL